MGITLITVVLTAVTGLVLLTLLSNQRNVHTVQAMAYAQEGLEAMRFIRDSNWMQNYSWDGGKALWKGDFDLDNRDSYEWKIVQTDCPPCFEFSSKDSDVLLVNGQEFEFFRTVKILPVEEQEDTVEVLVTVEWTDRGVDRSLEVSSFLSDWQ